MTLPGIDSHDTTIAIGSDIASVCFSKNPTRDKGETRKCYVDEQRNGTIDEIRTTYVDGSVKIVPAQGGDLVQYFRPMEPHRSRAMRTLRDLRFADNPNVASQVVQLGTTTQFSMQGATIRQLIADELGRSRALIPPVEDPIPSYIDAGSTVTVASRWSADDLCTFVWLRTTLGTDVINVMIGDPKILSNPATAALKAIRSRQPAGVAAAKP